MKNLKKLLTAFVLVALLISSVVTVAIAEASYTGTVAEATEHLDAIKEAKPEEGKSLLDAEKALVVKAYEYLSKNPVNPSDKGYEAMIDRYNDYTLATAYLLLKGVDFDRSASDVSSALAEVYDYVASAPIIASKPQKHSIALGYACANDGCGTYVPFSDAELYKGIDESAVCVDGCIFNAMDLQPAKLYSYADFESELGEASFGIAGELLDAIYNTSADNGYFSFLEKQNIAVDFINKSLAIEYKTPVSEAYTGDVATVSAMLAAIDKEAEFNAYADALAEIYKYIVATPIYPVSSEAAEFAAAYEASCELLSDKLEALVNSLSSPAEKVAVLVSFRGVLAGKPAVLEDAENGIAAVPAVAAVQYSEKTVERYNELCETVIAELRDAGAALADVPMLEVTFEDVEYDAIPEKFVEDLELVEALGAEDAKTHVYLAALYENYIKTSAFDPESENYSGYIARYKKIACDYVQATYVDRINNLIQVGDRYAVLVSFREFVAASPLCEEVVALYNDARLQLRQDAATLNGKIGIDKLPVYEEPSAPVSTVSYPILNKFLSTLQVSYDRYITASAEDKAAAFAVMQKSATDMYFYIKGSVINTADSDYESFIASYSTLRDNIADELLAIIEEANDEGRIAAIESVKAFLAAAPLTFDAVDSYNELVSELLSEDADAYFVDSIYYDILDGIAILEGGDCSDDELLAAGIAVQTAISRLFDNTDPVYEAVKESFDNSCRVLGDVIYNKLSYAIVNLSSDEAAPIVDYLFTYVEQVNTFETVLGVRKALKSTADTCAAIIEKIDSNFDAVACFDDVYADVAAVIASFDKASGIASKFEIFKELHQMVNYDNFTTFFQSGSSYAGIMAEYDRVAGELEELLIGLLDTDLSATELAERLGEVYDYLNELCFSARVVDAYNETLKAAIDASYEKLALELEEKCSGLAYQAPAGYSTNLSRVFSALNSASQELKGGETDFYEYLVAYRILSVDTEDGSDTIFDPACNDYFDAVETFNLITEEVADFWLTKIEAASALTEAEKLLEEYREFISENPFSKDMIESYNGARISLYDKYRANASAVFKGYEELVTDLYSHLVNCPVKESALSAYAKAQYNVMKTLVSAAEYGVVMGNLDSLDSLEGETALIYQNLIRDKLSWSFAHYDLGSHSDRSLAYAVLQNQFCNFIALLDADLSNLSDEHKARQIRAIGDSFVEASFPSELLEIYNKKFGTDFASAPIAKATEAGSLLDLAAYLADVELAESKSINEMRIALAGAVEYLNGHIIDSTDIRESVEADFDELEKKLAENTEAAKLALNKQTKLSDFSYPLQQSYDHENSKIFGSSFGPAAEREKNHTHSVKVDSNGNKYAMIETTGANNAYLQVLRIDYSNSFVIELDVMSPENLNFHLNSTGTGLGSITSSTLGKYLSTKVLQFTDNKLDYKFGIESDTREEQYFENYVEGKDAPIEAVPGEWMHIIIVMNFETRMYELLIDYVSLGERPIISGYNGKEDTCTHSILRFNVSNDEAGKTAYDNLMIYSGTSYRTLDLLDKMTNDEKFEFYASNALDESQDSITRIVAYTEAKGLIPYLTSACDQTLLEALKSYDGADIRESAYEAHLNNLEEIVKNVNVETLTSATASEQSASVSSALSYIDSNRFYIDQLNPRFIEINETLIDANAKIEWIENLRTYLDNISRFHRATSHAALVRHAESVKESYLLCELNKEDKAKIAAADPLAKSFVENMNGDAGVIDLVGSVDFGSYYTEYMPARIQSQLYLENSYKMLDCIEFIESVVPDKEGLEYDEYLAELSAKAIENYDFVDAYLTVIRNLVNADAYQPSVPGIDYALEIFGVLDVVFFEQLQTHHYSVIKEQLDKYATTSSYIGKAGICTYIERYIAENGVDMSGATGAHYLYVLEVYKSELESYKIDYEAILAANTESFIGVVSRMQTYVTYSELKPLYDLAIENYYYSMNADSEEVRAAIALFEAVEAQLTEWETNGAMLIGYAENLTSRRQAQKYRALVNCANYVDLVDEGVEGVAKALALYEKTLAEYNETISPVNAEISEVSDVVCSVRTESVAATILAIIKNLFN